jgi:RNA polymerase sigma-70 factor, ECF subfamily
VVISEPELVRRAQAGNETAFGQLVEAHSERVYGALRRFGLRPDEAEDVAQEVFLRAWRGLARFEGRAQLSTWLYRIAFNEAQRRLAKREPVNDRPQAGGEDAIARVPLATHLSPQRQVLEHDFTATLDRALAQLPAEWRVAVVLRDIEGLSTEEAAAVVGVREAAFKSRLHRGRMKLRVLLEPYLELDRV